MAVIDVGLPGADGLTFVRRLRSAGKSLPTLILTARCTLTDKVKALDLGADDFLSKPFEGAELAARCRALMRRAHGALNGIIKLNRMSVELLGRRMCIDDVEVELTAREWLVLECLVRHVGLIVSKERAATGGGRSGSRHHAERRGSACFAPARQARAGRRHPQPARPGISPGRSEARVNSSISRQLILWLAIPLMLVALCGALVHYFNNVAPGVIGSDRRLKEAAIALMAHVSIKQGQVTLDPDPNRKPPLPRPDLIRYALRDAQGRLLAGDAQLPVVAMSSETSQQFALTQIDRRSLRTLTTRFDTPAGVITITVADTSGTSEPEARLGFMSTLLWDFVQLDLTLVLVWVGIQLGLRPIRRLRDEIARRSPLDLRPIVESSVPREIAPLVITLNRLFGMLRTSVQSQQQFIANTAHQLRTPITGMQAQLGLLIAEPAAQPVKARLLTLQEGVKQLAHSANQLLTLARADSSANLSAKNQAVDLQAIVGEVVAKFFDRALQSNIDLGRRRALRVGLCGPLPARRSA